MWTATLDLSPRRVLLTQLLGRFWQRAYLSSFAPLRVENMPRQQLQGAQWVRVRNRLAGICGSDLHLIAVDGDLRVAPAALPDHAQTYLGHEVVGEVIEVGDAVQRVHIGDRVVLQHGMNCLAAGITAPCRSCASGNYALCELGNLPGPYPLGGGWSEEMLLHEQQLFPIPQDMSDEQAVLLKPTSVAVHAVLRRIPEPGEHVLITGAGTIGLLTLQAVRALSPGAEISVLARYPFQVEKATRMGASHIIYPQDSYREVQRVTQARLYDGKFGNQMLLGGYDVVYDTIGSRGTLHNALRWTRAQGTIVLVGLHLHFMNIDLSPIWYQEINLIGTMGQGMETWPRGTSEQRSTFDITSDLIMQQQLQPELLITHHFALSNYRVALQTAMQKQQGRAIKVVFDYSMQPASVVPNVRASARVKSRVTTTLFPAQTDEATIPAIRSAPSVQITIEPTIEPTPIAPLPPASPVSPVQPDAQPSSPPEQVPAVSTQLDIHESSTNEEPTAQFSQAVLPDSELEATEASVSQEVQEVIVSPAVESQASSNGFHEYTAYDDDKHIAPNGHHQQEVPGTSTEEQGQTEPEESFYSFYDSTEGDVEQTDALFAERDDAIDISADTSFVVGEEWSSSTEELAGIESSESDVEEALNGDVDSHLIAPAEEEKQTSVTKTAIDKGQNRPKRRRKTHYLVLPQSQQDVDTIPKDI